MLVGSKLVILQLLQLLAHLVHLGLKATIKKQVLKVSGLLGQLGMILTVNLFIKM